MAIEGANGAGKTTVLRIAATTSRPNAGRVEVCGVDAALDPAAARRGLSSLAQDAPLYPELTALEHVRWWARAQGAGRIDAQDALVRAGLKAAADRPAGRLSRGQRQRLALALALLPDRPLLILDEPLTALDGEARAWLLAELAARRGRQAVLASLHDESAARELATRRLRLHDGRLEAIA